jgi:hypothetical protein
MIGWRQIAWPSRVPVAWVDVLGGLLTAVLGDWLAQTNLGSTAWALLNFNRRCQHGKTAGPV